MWQVWCKTDEGLFLGYSPTSKAYRVFNKSSLKIEESFHVVSDETNPQKERKMSIFYDDIGSPREASPKSEEVVNNKPQEEPSLQQHHLPKECIAPNVRLSFSKSQWILQIASPL